MITYNRSDMAKRHPGLTLEEHLALGEKLREIQGFLTHECVRLGTLYPVTSKVNKMVNTAASAMSGLRCELDSLIFREHVPARIDSESAKDVYYGPEPARSQSPQPRIES